MNSRRTIQMFPDLGHRWPIWEVEAGSITPTDLDLSADLTARLRAWYDFWEVHRHWERSWDDPTSEAASYIEGSEIIATMRREVGDGVEVLDKRPALSAAAEQIVSEKRKLA